LENNTSHSEDTEEGYSEKMEVRRLEKIRWSFRREGGRLFSEDRGKTTGEECSTDRRAAGKPIRRDSKRW
jgi:hypothetical protein